MRDGLRPLNAKWTIIFIKTTKTMVVSKGFLFLFPLKRHKNSILQSLRFECIMAVARQNIHQ